MKLEKPVLERNLEVKLAKLKQSSGLALVKITDTTNDLILIDCTVHHTPPAEHYHPTKGKL